MRFPTIEIGRPQRWAAVLLLVFLGQCLWVVNRQVLTERDYRFARCGREMWEKPSPLAGYFTTCGNIRDGSLAYRVAGLPLTLQRIVAGQASSTSTWEMRHEVSFVRLLLRLPFIAFGMWLGGGLWWVARRLYGNEGGFLALVLYCFSPEVIRACLSPNNEVLAMWGLYGVVYLAIGVAHAMQGPRRKWKPRIVLLTIALGLTAGAHIAAGLLGLALAVGFMMYLAEERRREAVQVLAIAAAGAVVLLFAQYAFHLDAFSYVFRGAGARMWFSLDGAKELFGSVGNAGITIAAAVAAVLYLAVKRSRYFGNTTPLLIAAILLPLVTTGVPGEPWLWALPFALTFTGGVFADVLESRQRKAFIFVAILVMATQAALCVLSLPGMAR